MENVQGFAQAIVIAEYQHKFVAAVARYRIGNAQAGFQATVEVMAKIAANGRTINQAEVEMGATRTTEPAQPGAGSVDLGVYDRLTERASA